ncbi:MAG: proline hydroxylase [Acetobacteraceae bacterium]|nr:proline hydroxylase [Acetobacteraceae bacterium]
MNLPDLNPTDLEAEFSTQGHAVRHVLDAAMCHDLARLWDDEVLFRKTIIMQQHAYGRGEYRYLAYPLPGPIAALREALYPPLAAIANGWRQRLGQPGLFPPTLGEFLDECHAAGQTRPTPLMLRYGPGDFNCLHQDLYGERVFPLQVVILLSDPGRDFTGGELLLVEQRPRAQSRAEIVNLSQGDAAIFPVHHRPAEGAKGPYRLTVRHGVSRVRSGDRQTLGLIFHDAA